MQQQNNKKYKLNARERYLPGYHSFVNWVFLVAVGCCQLQTPHDTLMLARVYSSLIKIDNT